MEWYGHKPYKKSAISFKNNHTTVDTFCTPYIDLLFIINSKYTNIKYFHNFSHSN